MESAIDPVVISVPEYKEPMEGGDTLRRLVLRVVGIDILERGSVKA